MNKLTEVWTIDENTRDKFPGCPIMVCSTKEEATRRCRILNKRNAFGCELDEDGDYVPYSANDDNPEGDYLYYDVGGFDIDPYFEPE